MLHSADGRTVVANLNRSKPHQVRKTCLNKTKRTFYFFVMSNSTRKSFYFSPICSESTCLQVLAAFLSEYHGSLKSNGSGLKKHFFILGVWRKSMSVATLTAHYGNLFRDRQNRRIGCRARTRDCFALSKWRCRCDGNPHHSIPTLGL